MSWFRSANVTILNGGSVVTINSGEDVSLISSFDAFLIAGFDVQEIKNAYIDGSNNKFIELMNPWPNADQNNVAATVIPTAGDLSSATAALRDAVNLLNANFKSQPE